MRAIETLMKRLGLVKLSDYGLVLTPEGRVMSMRPAVLDDGFGGKIVGWQDGDLAAAELEPWPAAAGASAPRQPAPRPPMPLAAAPAPMPIAATPAPATLAAPPVRAVAPPPAVVTPVAPPAPVSVVTAPPEEDDWEWTIAMARARAAADETEQALAPPAPAPRTAKSTMQPVAAASTEKPTARFTAVRSSASRIARGTPAPFPAAASTTSPATVIPVPSLPTVNHVAAAQLAPVVRSPKVTRNAIPRTDFEDTVVSMPPAPPSEDTVPHLALPVTRGPLPSVKRLGRA